jgi:hypothetical protein
VRCDDRSCSVNGFCPVSRTQRVVPFNNSPRLQLLPVTAADGQGVVQVPRGWLYSFCDPGRAGTISEPCDTGAYYVHMCCALPSVFFFPLFEYSSRSLIQSPLTPQFRAEF